MNDLVVVGTRPEIIKVAPFVQQSGYTLLHTGQHRELAQEAFDIFQLTPHIDLKLMKVNQTPDEFITTAVVEISKIIKELEIDRIWVHGDTASALAGARAGKENNITICHIEAGLRTFDMSNPYPEESYRVEIDAISDLLFAPTETEVHNLEHENVKGSIYQVGNIVVDSLNMMKQHISDKRPIREKYILATVHRRESFGKAIRDMFNALKIISTIIKVVVPAHLNPNVRQALHDVKLSYIEPLNYVELLTYLKHCELVVTDSGGIQEEAPSFGKPVVLLRSKTERPQTLEYGYGFMPPILSTDKIVETITDTLHKSIKIKENPFGDGKTCKRILKIVKN